jgi:hypothetical protein
MDIFKKKLKIFVILILFLSFIFYTLLTIAIYKSNHYQKLKLFIYNNDFIKDRLGSVKGISVNIFGRINLEMIDGRAEYEVKIKGEKGKGFMHILMLKNSSWDLKVAVLKIGPEKYDLLSKCKNAK